MEVVLLCLLFASFFLVRLCVRVCFPTDMCLFWADSVCFSLRSRHEDLDLMPLEEYLQVEDPAVLDQCGDDEHLLMLARLRFELKSRQEFVDSPAPCPLRV